MQWPRRSWRCPGPGRNLRKGADVDDGSDAPLRVADAVDAACIALQDQWTSSDQRSRVAAILQAFAGFCANGHGISTLGEVTPATAQQFLHAPCSDGSDPSLRLKHLRRTSLRLLFRAARSTGWPGGDPTLDLALPPRPGRSTRPLTDEEVALCRTCAVWSLTDSRRAAAWALAEATCRTGELAYIRVADVDLDRGRVWLHGGRRTTPRWGHLTEWGTAQVERRLTAIDAQPPEAGLIYQGTERREGGRVSSSLALLDVLRRAGLATEPGVRPSSIAGWAGRQVLAETGRIDLVALRLGLTRLDTTADFIGWDWRQEPGA
jgi:integrase